MGGTISQHTKKDKNNYKHEKLLQKYRYNENDNEYDLAQNESNLKNIRKNNNDYLENEKLWNIWN